VKPINAKTRAGNAAALRNMCLRKRLAIKVLKSATADTRRKILAFAAFFARSEFVVGG
jgi:hypothetical protein